MTPKTRIALALSFITGLAILWTFWQAGHSRVIDGTLPLQYGSDICSGNMQAVDSFYIPGVLTQTTLSQEWQDYLGTFARGCKANFDFSMSVQPWQTRSQADPSDTQIEAFKTVALVLDTRPITVTLVRLKTGEEKIWPDFSMPLLPTTGRAYINSSFAEHLASFEVSQPAIAFTFKNTLYLGIQVQISPMGQNMTNFSARLYTHTKTLTEARGVGYVDELPKKYHGAFSSTEGRGIDKTLSPVMWLWYAFDDPSLFNPDGLYLGMQVNVENGSSPSQTAFVQVAVDQRPDGQSPLYNARLSMVPHYDIFHDVSLISSINIGNGTWQWQFSVLIDTSDLAKGQQVELGCDPTILYLNDDTGISVRDCGGYNQIFVSGEKRRFTLTFQVDNPGKTPQAVRLEYRFNIEGIVVPVTLWKAAITPG